MEKALKKKSLLAVSIVILMGLWFYWERPANVISRTPKSTQQESEIQSPLPQTPTAPAQASNLTLDSSEKTRKTELESLSQMSRSLFQFTRPDSRLVDLVSYLESSRQEPVVTKDSNPDTGELVIVRTRRPLPGTRYFHAQYFAGDDKKSFVQHMSFEYKPGPTALREAMDAIQESFGVIASEAKIRKVDYIQWNLEGHQILWLKKLNEKDLQDNPFNAYTPL
jgi:hypothetical protein